MRATLRKAEEFGKDDWPPPPFSPPRNAGTSGAATCVHEVPSHRVMCDLPEPEGLIEPTAQHSDADAHATPARSVAYVAVGSGSVPSSNQTDPFQCRIKS